MAYVWKLLMQTTETIKNGFELVSRLIPQFEMKVNFLQVGGQKGPPPSTSFSLVTSTNVGVSPKNFLTFHFNHFATLVPNFKTIPTASPKLVPF